MQLVSLVLLLSGLQLPPPLLDRPDLPSELAHAQEQGLSRRITSYNVCYTKLLRGATQLAGIMSGGRRRAGPVTDILQVKA